MAVAAHQFWAGVIFTAACLLFLWGAFNKQGPIQQMHYQIVHFVCALCAGAAGAFFTGAALLSIDTPIPGGGKFIFQGAAGVALFAFVFIIFRKVVPPGGGGGTPEIIIAPGTTTTFHQVAETLAEQAGATIDLKQLTKQERSQVPRSENLRCGTLDEAKQSLMRLGTLVTPGSIRPYKVELKGKHFTLTV